MIGQHCSLLLAGGDDAIATHPQPASAAGTEQATHGQKRTRMISFVLFICV
jgi:hypothetical protein